MRGDDGLGFIVAQGLAETMRDAGVKVFARHQLHPEMALEISRAGFVIFIDARVGDTAGAVDVIPVYPDVAAPLTFSHHLPPGVLLACTKALHGVFPSACLVTVTGESFEFGRGLSDAVKERIPHLIDCVTRILDEVRKKEPPPP